MNSNFDCGRHYFLFFLLLSRGVGRAREIHQYMGQMSLKATFLCYTHTRVSPVFLSAHSVGGGFKDQGYMAYINCIAFTDSTTNQANRRHCNKMSFHLFTGYAKNVLAFHNSLMNFKSV